MWYQHPVVFHWNFRFVKSNAWNVMLNILTVCNRVFRVNWKKNVALFRNYFGHCIETCVQISQKMAFCSPRIVYQMFSCSSGTTLLIWFCKARHFQTFLIFPFHISSVYLLPLRISVFPSHYNKSLIEFQFQSFCSFWIRPRTFS